MPIITTQNLKKDEIYNMMEFKINKINKDEDGNFTHQINNKLFTYKDFRENVLPAFGCTVYKY